MKKLTLLLAALSLIVGALFLTACSEPMSSETDDGLAAVPEIHGDGKYWDGDSWEILIGNEINTITLHDISQLPTAIATTVCVDGEYSFGQRPTGTYFITGTYGDLSDNSGTFGHVYNYDTDILLSLD
ncbi:hypothetical protein K8R78_05900 [bacterium]|nr:hypothetical protein [bacterium]